MNFGLFTVNKVSIQCKTSTQIQIFQSFIFKLKMFMKTLKMVIDIEDIDTSNYKINRPLPQEKLKK